MNNNLKKDVTFVKSIGKKLKLHLNENNIHTCYDLLNWNPVRYEIMETTNICSMLDNKDILVNGKICSEVVVTQLKSNQSSLIFNIDVNGKIVKVIVTDNSHIRLKLNKNDLITVYGKIQFKENKLLSKKIFTKSITNYIVPIYKIGDMPQVTLKRLISNVYDLIKNEVSKENDDFLTTYTLIDKYTFYKLLHYPKSKDDLKKVAVRYKYDTYKNILLSKSYDFLNVDALKIIDYFRNKDMVFNDYISRDEEETLYNQIYVNIKNVKTNIK